MPLLTARMLTVNTIAAIKEAANRHTAVAKRRAFALRLTGAMGAESPNVAEPARFLIGTFLFGMDSLALYRS